MIRYAIKKNIWVYSKFGETIPSSKLTHVFLQKSCILTNPPGAKCHTRTIHLESPRLPKETWWIQRCWIVFMKICLPSIKRIMYMFFQEHILFLRFGQVVSRYRSKVTHFSRMIQRSRNFWAYQHSWSRALAHFLLDPSHPTSGAAKLLKTEPWKCNRLFIEFEIGEVYYSKLDISSYPFLLISNELWPTAEVLLFLQDGLNLLQVSLAWYRWSFWDADSWPRVVQKNHVFTMESKVRSAEVTYPPEV